MAKTGLVNISTNNTFQVWLDRTNELVNIIGTDVLTASASPGDTTGSVSSPKVATLIGTFTANTITAETRLRTDKIETTSTDVTIEAPTIINSSQAVGLESFSNSANPVLRLNNDSVSWDVGFLNAEDFTINNGSGVERLKLTPAGDLTIAGSITTSGGGAVTADVTGNITGDVTGDVTGNVTGDVTGNLTGNVTGNVTGDITGSVTVPASESFDISDASSFSLPEGFGIVPRRAIIMWSGSVGDIPSGWGLCDGTTYTFKGVTTAAPDLQNRFIVGAGDSYAVGATGGENNVTLTEAQMPEHDHIIIAGTTSFEGSHQHYVVRDASGSTYSLNQDQTIVRRVGAGGSENYSLGGIDDFGANVGLTSTKGAHKHDIAGATNKKGSSTAHENRPPYYALAYIIKL